MWFYEMLGISLLPVDLLASEEEFGTMELSFFEKKLADTKHKDR
jgi:hypothetical protein